MPLNVALKVSSSPSWSASLYVTVAVPMSAYVSTPTARTWPTGNCTLFQPQRVFAQPAS